MFLSAFWHWTPKGTPVARIDPSASDAAAPDLRQRLSDSLVTATRTEKAVAAYLLTNFKSLPFETAASVARKIGVSEASIGRYCRAIGFRHFKDLKASLQSDLGDRAWLIGDRLRDFAARSRHDKAEMSRGLEREIAAICRKIARDIVLGKLATLEDQGKNKIRLDVTDSSVETYLGIPKFHNDKREGKDDIGLVNGLAWTEVGGTTLPIEVVVMPGRGKIILTGSLGEVMKESAHASLSYLRSHADEINMRPIDYDSIDLHIHFPEGAVPKDGPSAGIAIATAIYSALNEVPVRNDFAMTGEITLRGRVLPVGGIKEKLLAAHRQNISNIILSNDNEKELEEVPPQILKNLTIYKVGLASEVLKLALRGEPKKSPLVFSKRALGTAAKQKTGKKKKRSAA